MEGVLIHPTHPVCMVACMGGAYSIMHVVHTMQKLKKGLRSQVT